MSLYNNMDNEEMEIDSMASDEDNGPMEIDVHNQDGHNNGLDFVEMAYDGSIMQKMAHFKRILTEEQVPEFEKIEQSLYEKIQELEYIESSYQCGMVIRHHIQEKNQTSTVRGPGYPSEQDCLTAHEDAQSQASGSDNTVQEVKRKIKEHEQELEKLNLRKDCMIKLDLSCIDFEAYRVIPESLYFHMNDIKSTSACPCFCVAFLINRFLFDAGYNLRLDLTEFFKVLSAITNEDEDSLRKSFCNPECDDIDVFQVFLKRYLIQRDLIYQKGQFKMEELKSVLSGIIHLLQRSGQQENTFMLGIGYKNKSLGHCINFFLLDNRMAVLDTQNGGHCRLNVFEGVDDIRVYSLRKPFKDYVLRTLPKTKEIRFIDLIRICKAGSKEMSEL